MTEQHEEVGVVRYDIADATIAELRERFLPLAINGAAALAQAHELAEQRHKEEERKKAEREAEAARVAEERAALQRQREEQAAERKRLDEERRAIERDLQLKAAQAASAGVDRAIAAPPPLAEADLSPFRAESKPTTDDDELIQAFADELVMLALPRVSVPLQIQVGSIITRAALEVRALATGGVL